MLGERIAALRKNAGISQAVLAQRLQVSPSTVGMYEQNRREPSVSTLISLARIFHVTTDYLLTGKPSDKNDGKILNEIALCCLDHAEKNMGFRKNRPFSREELAAFIAAMLAEP